MIRQVFIFMVKNWNPVCLAKVTVKYFRTFCNNQRAKTLNIAGVVFQYFMKRLTARSRKVSNPRGWVLKCLYTMCRFKIWLAAWQLFRLDVCQISKRLKSCKHQSRAFETSWDLVIRLLKPYSKPKRPKGIPRSHQMRSANPPVAHRSVKTSQSVCGLSQWQKASLCNAFSHWPSPYLAWSLVARMT